MGHGSAVRRACSCAVTRKCRGRWKIGPGQPAEPVLPWVHLSAQAGCRWLCWGGALMAEPSAAAPRGAAVSGQDVLAATKLHVPRRGRGSGRGRGWRRRSVKDWRGRLILVCAPAGSGKTALLAGWAPSGNRPVAWLSLDAADNDPVRFWRHTVAALDRARPGIGETVGLLLGPPPSASFEGLVTARDVHHDDA